MNTETGRGFWIKMTKTDFYINKENDYIRLELNLKNDFCLKFGKSLKLMGLWEYIKQNSTRISIQLSF